MAKQKRQFDPSEAVRKIIAQTEPAPQEEADVQPELVPVLREDAPARDRLIQRSFYLYESQAVELKIRAAQKRTDMSSLLREALNAYFRT